MSYRSLLVYLDHDAQCETRTRAAIEFAQSHDCHLEGVVPLGRIDLPSAWDTLGAMVQMSAQAREALRGPSERLAERFRAACQAAGVQSFEVSIDDADKAKSLVSHANFNDLTMVSQAQPSTPAFAATRAIVEQVVLNSARPTLIIPYVGYWQAIGQQVLVAWDDSREASRAVFDALPMLRRARSVHLISWNERDDSDDLLRRRLEALQRWLARHAVPAEVLVERSSADIGEALLSRAADIGSDLIVMGAYGTPRWTERMMGGATRDLLGSMTVPVLMSR